MDEDYVVSTIVGEVCEQIDTIRQDLIQNPSPGQTEKDHLKMYAKLLKEQARLLETAAYFAQG